MSEFEIYEALMMTTEMGVFASMNFVAIVFAYLVAAFVTGKSLSRTVALTLSATYTIFLVPHFVGCLTNITGAYDAGVYLSATFPDSWAATGASIPMAVLLALFGVPMLLGWIGSLFYMHGYIRSSDSHSERK